MYLPRREDQKPKILMPYRTKIGTFGEDVSKDNLGAEISSEEGDSFWVWIFLNEIPPLSVFIGGAVIILAIILKSLDKKIPAN